MSQTAGLEIATAILVLGSVVMAELVIALRSRRKRGREQ